MKIIFLIAALLILSIVSGKVIEIKKKIARTTQHEDLALEIEFLGTCQEFRDRVLPTLWVSQHQPCLPIQVNVTENPDYDDLTTHYFCTNINEKRSIAHFVEIFTGTDETVQFPNFVVSLVPSAPIRVLTHRVALNRRPNCWVTNDYCNSSNAVVNDCKFNEVVFRRRDGRPIEEHREGEFREGQQFHDGQSHDGHFLRKVEDLGRNGEGDRDRHEERYVVSHDRIYITANSNVSSECKTSVTECCAYILPSIFGGICHHEAPTDLLLIPKEHHDRPHEEHHDRPHEEHHDRPEDRPHEEHHDRPHEEHHDRPHEEHHDRPHEEHHDRPEDRPHEEHHDRPHEEHHDRPEEHHEHHNDGDNDHDDHHHKPDHKLVKPEEEENDEDDNTEEKK